MEAYDFTGFWEIPGFEFEDNYHGQSKLDSEQDSIQRFDVEFEFDSPNTTPETSSSWLDGVLFGWGEIGDHQNSHETATDPTTPAPVGQEQDLEYILLSMFGAIVAIFILCQIIIYLRNCTEKRHTWRIGRRRWWNILKRTKHSGGFKCGGITIPSTSNTVWAHTYDPYEVVPCRPGLAYTARPTSLYSDLDYRGSSTASSERGSYREEGTSRSSRSFSSTTVFMVDPRGHYTSRLSASPEISIERDRSSSSGSGTLPADNSSSGSEIAITRRPALKRGSRRSRMISTAVQCENPGYDTDSSYHDSRLPPQPRSAPGCARRNSSTTSNRSTGSIRGKALALRKARETSSTNERAIDVGNNNDTSEANVDKPATSTSGNEQRQSTGASGEHDRDSHHSDISLTSVSSMSGMSSQTNKRPPSTPVTSKANVPEEN